MAAPARPRRRTIPKTNLYAGDCSRCGIPVAEDEGEFFPDPLRLACAACSLREGVTDDNGLSIRMAAFPIQVKGGKDLNLLPFQVEDCRRIATTRALLIGSQMGTGKTVQAAVGAIRMDRPNLIFCPASVRENWIREIKLWRPDIRRVRTIGSQLDFSKNVYRWLEQPGHVFVGSFGALPGGPCRGCVGLRAKLRKLNKWKEKYCPHCDFRKAGPQVCMGCDQQVQKRRDGKAEDGKRQRWITFCPRCDGDQTSLKGADSCLGCDGSLEDRFKPRYFGALHGSNCAHAPKRPPEGAPAEDKLKLREAAHHPPYVDVKIDGQYLRLPYHAAGSDVEAWIRSGIPFKKNKRLPYDVGPDFTLCKCGEDEEDHQAKVKNGALHSNGCKRFKPAFCSGCCQANPQPEIDTPVVLIADECHAFKTGSSQRTKNWRGLRKSVWDSGGYVFGLSGTPCEGKPGEFWEVLTSLGLAKGAFGSLTKDYKRIFKGWYENQKGDRVPPEGALLDELHRRLRRVQINRRRKDVLKQLPPRQEIVIEVDISSDTIHEVNEAVHRMLAVKRAWDDVQKGAIHDGTRLMDPFAPHLTPDEKNRRTQIYNARVEYFFVERPWNTDEEIVEAVDQALMSKGAMPTIDELSRIRSMLSQAKVAAVKEWIEDREQEDEPVVLFSQHVTILKKVAQRPGWECFHGGLTPKKRSTMVDRFQSGETARGLAISIGAGGEGITLTRASVCAFVDLAWNPAKNQQAESRLIRIGAEKHKDKAAVKTWDRINRGDFSACASGAHCKSALEMVEVENGRKEQQRVAIPCLNHQARILVVRFVAKHIVDRLVIETLKEKEALLSSLEWDEEESA